MLRQIFNFAIACGYIETNPTRGLKKNRRAPLTRFLSRDEIARLHETLDRQTRASDRQQADIVRLLLLTGGRRGEILGLRRSEVRGDMLVLADSKPGPRRVLLNVQARRILERQSCNGSAFVFPSPRDPDRPRGPELPLWYRVGIGSRDGRVDASGMWRGALQCSMRIRHKVLRALHERDNPARVPAGLVPRLRRILFRLQEASIREAPTRRASGCIP